MTGPAPEARVHRLSSLPEDHPIPLLTRRRVIGELVMLSDVHLAKGCDVTLHEHANEQFAFVLSGRVRFRVQDGPERREREVVVTGGEVLHLPSNVPHAAFALEDCRILDVFAPPSAQTGIDRQR